MRTPRAKALLRKEAHEVIPLLPRLRSELIVAGLSLLLLVFGAVYTLVQSTSPFSLTRRATLAPDEVLDEEGLSVLHPKPLIKHWASFPNVTEASSAEVQAAINTSQNPHSCDKAKYLVWRLNNFGIGSDIHTIGWALGFAMALDRVLVYHADSHWIYTSPTACPGRETPDCFFRPLSTCQDYLTQEEMANATEFDPRDPKAFEAAKVLRLRFPDNNDFTTFVPPAYAAQHDRSWWRAQTTKYIVQPSAQLTSWVERYMADSLRRYPMEARWAPDKDLPPESAICVHVRHGDKAIEMKLHPLGSFMQKAVDLVSLGASRNIFITTDDESVIEEVVQGTYDEHDFIFYYLNYDRRNDLSPMDSAKTLGNDYFGRVSLANLYLGVHPACKWFVQTTGSNWNRLINEIRKMDGSRQYAAWADLEPGEWR